VKIPLVIAHRGASAYLPENTLEAFRLAFEKYGADMVELDVRLTADGIPVVMHDARLDRMTGVRGYVSECTVKQLKALTPLTLPSPLRGEGKGEGKFKIPTFEEILVSFPNRKLAVEIKERAHGLVWAVTALIQKYNAEKNVIVGSKHHEVAKTLQKNFPGLRRFLSQREVAQIFFDFKRRKSDSLKDPLAVASIPRASCGMRFDTQDFIDTLHRKEIQVFFWTINDPEQMRSLWQKGADGIITDDPGLARRVLDRLPGTVPTNV